MKKLFYITLLLFLAFEFFKIYFIMPMPGSQTINSIDFAYFLHQYRWVFRGLFSIFLLIGSVGFLLKPNKGKWLGIIMLLVFGAAVYAFNRVMVAEKMFLQPTSLVFKNQNENKIPEDRIVIGVSNNGESKAYPISFLAYHHQLIDTVGGKRVMVTYCSVCHTGRVYEPLVAGKTETFRLVGMDHFNAMFEDQTTKSWWQQATGEAITGELKGTTLPDFPFVQMGLTQWFKLFPKGVVLQCDTNFMDNYDTLARYEKGKSKGSLTRTDSLSWKDKSWVAGITVDGFSKAYDWNMLASKRIINDKIGDTHIVLLLASDKQSFMAFKRTNDALFTLQNDTLQSAGLTYNLLGQSMDGNSDNLQKIKVYQEFWHSWKTTFPKTEK